MRLMYFTHYSVPCGAGSNPVIFRTLLLLPALGLSSGAPCQDDEVRVSRLHNLKFSHYRQSTPLDNDEKMRSACPCVPARQNAHRILCPFYALVEESPGFCQPLDPGGESFHAIPY